MAFVVASALASTLIAVPAQSAPTEMASDTPIQQSSDDAGGLARPDGVSAAVTAKATGQRVEDLSLRTPTEQVFANPDGTWTSEVSPGARFYEHDGALVPIGDAAQLRAPDDVVIGDGTELAIAQGAENVGSGPTDESVALATLSAVDQSTDDEVSLELGWEDELPEPVVADNIAVYSHDVTVKVQDTDPVNTNDVKTSVAGDSSDVQRSSQGSSDEPDTASARIEVEPLKAGFAHRTVIDQVPAGDVIQRFPVNLSEGLRLIKEDQTGDLRVLNNNDDTVFFAPAPTMWDAAIDEKSGLFSAERRVDTDILHEDGVFIVQLRADAEWLQDPARVYPVTIDPSWTRGASDTWAQSDVTGSKAGDAELRVGTYNGGTV